MYALDFQRACLLPKVEELKFMIVPVTMGRVLLGVATAAPHHVTTPTTVTITVFGG